jgi:hypothetical protein
VYKLSRMAKKVTPEEHAANAVKAVAEARGMSVEQHVAAVDAQRHSEGDRSSYDAISRLNWSRLFLISRTPAHYARGKGDVNEATGRLGTAAHAATLEPSVFAREFIVFPGHRRGHFWDAFEIEAMKSGLQVLSQSEHDEASEIAGAVHRHPRASVLLSGGKAEQTLQWSFRSKSFSFDCKGRADYIRDDALVDLKSTGDASPEGFGWSVMSYGYLGQAAWYSDGLYLATGRRRPFYFVAVEKKY